MCTSNTHYSGLPGERSIEAHLLRETISRRVEVKGVVPSGELGGATRANRFRQTTPEVSKVLIAEDWLV
jgi:hypothetical protein